MKFQITDIVALIIGILSFIICFIPHVNIIGCASSILIFSLEINSAIKQSKYDKIIKLNFFRSVTIKLSLIAIIVFIIVTTITATIAMSHWNI